MVHSFSGCVLSCAEEVDLDELLATRLVSFLLDHHTDILSVPLYLHHVVSFGLRKPFLALSSSKAIRPVFRGKENFMIFEIRRWEELYSEIQSLLSFDNYQW